MLVNNIGLFMFLFEWMRLFFLFFGRKGLFKVRCEMVVKFDFDGKSFNEGDDFVVVETFAVSLEKLSESVLKEMMNVFEVGDMDI